ncbi:heparan-alpha-glucosaminide N-acetyltransferase [Oryzifoliimicrobium ureilyticus]|uniref:heparan-alpha-glucosaminide N-acetyltransferase n=1 Tax=Oryzifoliimicrobium ureilyticus TaxID=3113724 RepID=UPI00307624E6
MAVSAQNDLSTRPPRIGLIDTLRGVALIAMASYHFSWDLEFMGYLAPGTAETGLLKLYARAIASTFLFLVGVSLVLASTPAPRWNAYWKRLALVAGSAMLISVATFFFTPGEWIFFGILHCIAAATLVGLVFLRLPLALTILITLAFLGVWSADTFTDWHLWRSDVFDPRYLAWTGLAEAPVRSNDFVPLFPWLLPFLIGLTLARIGLKRRLAEKLAAVGTGTSLLARLGRHSLIFYLLHQPILIAIAWSMTFVLPPPKADPIQSYLNSCNVSCRAQEGEALCRSFCQCTLDKLQGQNLFTPFQSGAIKQDDERILSLAGECSAASRQ